MSFPLRLYRRSKHLHSVTQMELQIEVIQEETERQRDRDKENCQTRGWKTKKQTKECIIEYPQMRRLSIQIPRIERSLSLNPRMVGGGYAHVNILPETVG